MDGNCRKIFGSSYFHPSFTIASQPSNIKNSLRYLRKNAPEKIKLQHAIKSDLMIMESLQNMNEEIIE